MWYIAKKYKAAMRQQRQNMLFVSVIAITITLAFRARADIYQSEAECIKANSKHGSDPEMVAYICSNLIYNTQKNQSEIDFKKEKEQFEKTTLTLEKFMNVQEEREVERQERKRKEEEEKRKQKGAERMSLQEVQNRAYCKQLLVDPSRQFTQSEKKGVPRYWSEHYARSDPHYAECHQYR
jgi:hypothetical protein